MPDAELRSAADSGKLRTPDDAPDASPAHAARRSRSPPGHRVRAAVAAHPRFRTLDEKSERHFPTFTDLRGAMYEESIRFFTDLFQNDRSVLEPSRRRLHVPERAAGEALRHPRRRQGRSGGASMACSKFGRGGILGQADDAREAVGRVADQPDPARQLDQRGAARRETAAPAQGRAAAARRTRPPRSLTVRQLIEKHTSRSPMLPSATSGSTRTASRSKRSTRSAAGATRTWATGRSTTGRQLKDGAEFEGLDGLRNYLLTNARDAFVRQFCRKLLGYALGRAVQLSDEPLLDEMQKRSCKQSGYRVGTAVDTIVRSRQFREIRGGSSGPLNTEH